MSPAALRRLLAIVAFAAAVAFFLPGAAGAASGTAPPDQATLTVPDAAGEPGVYRTLDVTSVPPYQSGLIRRIQAHRGGRAPAIATDSEYVAWLGRAHVMLARTADEISRNTRGVTAVFAVTRAGRLSAPSTAPPATPF